MMIIEASSRHTAITKIDDGLGLVFGWASVSTVNGQPLIDKQGDFVPPDELLKASTAFMADARVAKLMHKHGVGEVLHSFPLDRSIAKAFGIKCDVEGWLVGMKVHDPEVFAAVREGRLSGLSIGGFAQRETA
jgi:hypothetical protein